MDVIRFGRGLRTLRRRRGWRQVDLAGAVGVSQSLIARLERGGADRLTVRSLDRITAALGARVAVRLDFNGEALDRLLDAGHASLVELVVAAFRAEGWPATEVTFAIDGERGAVDVFAWHPPSGVVLAIEVKSVIPDLQGTLTTLDRPTGLDCPRIGWTLSAVGRVWWSPTIAPRGAGWLSTRRRSRSIFRIGREVRRALKRIHRAPCVGCGSCQVVPRRLLVTGPRAAGVRRA
jgi:transcriptional regulator with XRE-family HTH domain